MSDYGYDGVKAVGDISGAITMAMIVGIAGFLALGIIFQAIPEALGREPCRKMLADRGLEDPERWPNCYNLEGQHIMKERYSEWPLLTEEPTQ